MSSPRPENDHVTLNGLRRAFEHALIESVWGEQTEIAGWAHNPFAEPNDATRIANHYVSRFTRSLRDMGVIPYTGVEVNAQPYGEGITNSMFVNAIKTAKNEALDDYLYQRFYRRQFDLPQQPTISPQDEVQRHKERVLDRAWHTEAFAPMREKLGNLPFTSSDLPVQWQLIVYNVVNFTTKLSDGVYDRRLHRSLINQLDVLTLIPTQLTSTVNSLNQHLSLQDEQTVDPPGLLDSIRSSVTSMRAYVDDYEKRSERLAELMHIMAHERIWDDQEYVEVKVLVRELAPFLHPFISHLFSEKSFIYGNTLSAALREIDEQLPKPITVELRQQHSGLFGTTNNNTTNAGEFRGIVYEDGNLEISIRPLLPLATIHAVNKMKAGLFQATWDYGHAYGTGHEWQFNEGTLPQPDYVAHMSRRVTEKPFNLVYATKESGPLGEHLSVSLQWVGNRNISPTAAKRDVSAFASNNLFTNQKIKFFFNDILVTFLSHDSLLSWGTDHFMRHRGVGSHHIDKNEGKKETARLEIRTFNNAASNISYSSVAVMAIIYAGMKAIYADPELRKIMEDNPFSLTKEALDGIKDTLFARYLGDFPTEVAKRTGLDVKRIPADYSIIPRSTAEATWRFEHFGLTLRMMQDWADDHVAAYRIARHLYELDRPVTTSLTLGNIAQNEPLIAAQVDQMLREARVKEGYFDASPDDVRAELLQEIDTFRQGVIADITPRLDPPQQER